MDDALRTHVLRTFGATGDQVQELLHYGANRFDTSCLEHELRLPLPDEPFVQTWERYAHHARERGVVNVLRERLMQLRFPVERGISDTAAYRDATRRGLVPAAAAGLDWNAPDAVRLLMHPTAAGRIPVIIAGDRADFVTLVRALTRKNEPDPIPASMGACMVAGYANWDRIAALGPAWSAAAKDMYQDRFILLTIGPYSSTPAACVGLDAEEWLALSLVIRREHECTHYFTRRLFGSMKNALLDELLADYAGLVAATGRFRSDWFLRFLGLEAYPSYRAGGRLENYAGQPPLSPGAVRILHALVKAAAERLEAVDESLRACAGDGVAGRAAIVAGLSRLTLEEIVCPASRDGLLRAVADASSRLLGGATCQHRV